MYQRSQTPETMRHVSWRWLAVLWWVWVSGNRLFLFLVIFKLTILFEIGENEYLLRLASYEVKTTGERFAMMAMGLDPATRSIRGAMFDAQKIGKPPPIAAQLGR